ncbi:MAG: hypothetical protein WB511_01265 [Nitrososphaeraceae archaeon]
MICKQTQNTMDTLLRLKDSPAINKITSLMKKPNMFSKDNETLCLSLITQVMDQHNQNNKIASTIKTIGEVPEFQSLIRSFR